MKAMPIVGILLAIAGAFVVFRGVNYTKSDNVLKLGDLSANIEHKQSVPAWIGGVALGAGVLLIVIGLARR